MSTTTDEPKTLAALADDVEAAEQALDAARTARNQGIYREKRAGGLSLSEIARQARVGRSFADRVCQGKGKPPSGEKAGRRDA